MEIIYTTISIKVPKGYEQQVMDIALMKVEGIISQLVLAPTQEKKTEYDTKILEAKAINKLSLKV